MSDIVVSPGIGILSDSIHTRWGRRRPLLLLGGVLSAVACYMLFNVPAGWEGAFKIGYLIAVMIFFTIAYGLVNITHMAMPVEMSSSPNERRKIIAYGMAMNTFGFLAGGAAFPLLVTAFGDGRRGYGIAGLALGLSVIVIVTLCVAGTYRAPFVSKRQAAFRLRETGSIVRNRPMMVYVAFEVVNALLVAGQSSLILFVIQGVMKLSITVSGLTTAASITVQFLMIPVWTYVARRWGNLTASLGLTVFGFLFSISWMTAVPGEPLVFLLARYALFGCMVSASSLSGMAIKSDITEYGYLTSGIRREGLYASIFNFMEKSSGAFGILVTGFVLSVGGFDRTLAPTADQSARAVHALFAGVAVLPAIGFVFGFFFLLRFYKLDDRILAQARANPVIAAEVATEAMGLAAQPA